MLEKAADEISLFPLEVVASGVVQIDSSSGSDSDSSTSSTDSSSPEVAQPDAKRAKHLEEVPIGVDFYKHTKSGIVHRCDTGQSVSSCKLTMSANYKKLERKLYVNYPKCLRCFPKDHNRIRNIKQMTESLDQFLKLKPKKG